MTAAGYFSLLKPSIEVSEKRGLVFRLIDAVLPHLHFGGKNPEGIKTHWKKTTLLILTITLHNIPEGIIGEVAFGSVKASLSYGISQSFAGAITPALSIGIQNLMPLIPK